MNSKHHNTWRVRLRHVLQSALNFSCLLCYQSSERAICHWCENDLFFFDAPTFGDNLLSCGLIARHVKHSHYHSLSVLGLYHNRLAYLMQKLKFNHSLAAGRALATLFYNKRVIPFKHTPQLLLPVPIHPFRLFSRHYNQATVLANDIGCLANIPVFEHWANRIGKQTQHQLNRSDRATNALSSFALSCRCIDHWVIDKHISCVAIVDDIVTTGVTVNSLAHQLQQRYPSLTIEVWAMAFTPPPKSSLLNE